VGEAAEEVLVEPFAVSVAEIQVCGENELHEVPG
jgi:hypothetical protein